jgi:N-acyl-D-amino-acid deacylase
MAHGRREFVKAGSLAAAGLAFARGVAAAPSEFELLLKGGLVLDGTGAEAFAADVGVRGGRIAALGTIAPEQARRVVDVAGLHVAPGFVDIHSHSDGDVRVHPGGESRVMQGVTTELTGNCGSSAAPFGGVDEAELRADWAKDGLPQVDWSDVASYCTSLERAGIALNQALLLGQGTLRRHVVGLVDRPLAADELARVLRLVEEGLEQGAFGLSTGLEYTPGRYTPTDEVVAMARVVARHGGLYASHVRNEEARLLEAVDEALAIGRRAGCRVQVSHLKAAGRVNWDKQVSALHMIEGARRSGLEALADAYPYTAYSTGLKIQLPAEALEGGDAKMLARLADPAQRAAIRAAVARQIAAEPGDPALIVIARMTRAEDQPLVGRSLAQIAEGFGVEPAEALLRLLEREQGDVSFVGHAMSEENVLRLLTHPLVMLGSDGRVLSPVGEWAKTKPHPRSYGAFVRLLGHYARERGALSLAEAVRKMTSMPADQIGLRDRGRVAPGKAADLVAFDAARVRDTATFDDPHRYPEGIAHVFVGGVAVVERGRATGARPGRALRRG